MKITRDFIEKNRSSKGGWNFSQLSSLGVEWPPSKGWIDRLIGTEASDEAIQKFIDYGKKRPTKSERKRIKANAMVGKQISKERRRVHWMKMVAAVSGDEFLKSYQWRRVRIAVLKRDGAQCACCGATRSDGVRMNVDHIKPRKLYPKLALDMNNLQVLCEVCNHGKGNWDMTDWRPSERVDDAGAAHLRSIMGERDDRGRKVEQGTADSKRGMRANLAADIGSN